MKVALAGTPSFAAVHLDALVHSHHEVVVVVTQPDKPGKRGKSPLAGPVKQYAAQAGIPVLQSPRLTVDDFSGYSFDLLVVVAFGQILGRELLAFPRYGCLNVHASLLPRWRGAAPVQRAILAGDDETGITLIKMDEGLDTGDMIARQAVSIIGDEAAGALVSRLSNVGQALLISTLDDMEAGNLTPVPQDEGAATYAGKIEKGEALIDWSLAAPRVDRHVRAFNPGPTAFSFLNGMRVKIHAGIPLDSPAGGPGEIGKVTEEGVLVGCGEGSYRLTRVQLPIGKGAVLGARDILNGRGDIFFAGASFTKRPG